MSQSKRLSTSLRGSWYEPTPLSLSDAPIADADVWIEHWKKAYAKDFIDSRVVSVDAETSVEEACDILLSEDIPCLAIKSRNPEKDVNYAGLFDFADVNAFLTLAATRHTLMPDDLRYNPRLDAIVTAARAGRVPVHLVSDLSEKNPLETLSSDATAISLLEIFSRGTHRVLIQSDTQSEGFLGMVSDRSLLAWFASYAKDTPSFHRHLTNPLERLSLPSLNLYDAVVASTSTSSVLDAMKLMSDEGVSSVAVLNEESSTLLSAVSVTDIGKVVVPFQSNQILSTPLNRFITHIKSPDGSMDGVDKYPVYSVSPSSTLSYTMEKLLATNAHRVFVTADSSSVLSPTSGNLSGIVSIVDILSIFARIAKIPDVDPTRMQRHRRASSASSHSSKSERDIFLRSRSSSRTGVRRSPSIITASSTLTSSPTLIPVGDHARRNSTNIVMDKARRESLKTAK